MKLLEIVSNTSGKLFYREYEDNPLKEGQVRVVSEFAAAKHGTEFTAFSGSFVFANNRFDEEYQLFLPKTPEQKGFGHRPGNMWVGHVSELGPGVTEMKIGDIVAGYGPFKTTHAVNVRHALRLIGNMTWKDVMCYDPLQFALGGVRDGNVRAGDVVVVFGLGAIGLMAAQLAKRAGAVKVIVCDPITHRREVALENGANHAIDSAGEDAGYIVKQLTNKRGADVIIETSGNYRALQAAIRSAAYNGTVAVVGWYHECKGGLDFGWEAHFNQPNILFSRACSEPNRDHPRWSFSYLCDICWHMLANGWFRCENIVDPVVPFDRAADAYVSIFNDPTSSVKLGVRF